jgi:hypothetical protein
LPLVHPDWIDKSNGNGMDWNHHLCLAKKPSERLNILLLQVQPGSTTINPITLTNSASIQKTLCREIVLSKTGWLAQASAIG